MYKKTLLLSACLTRVRIIDGTKPIAEHPRCFGKGEQIEDEQHINALWLAKIHATLHRGQDRLAQASSQSTSFLQQAVARGHVLKTTVKLLNQLLDNYGTTQFCYALQEAINRQSPYPQAVQQILEQQREEKQRPPPVAVAIPDKVKYIQVTPAKLDDYDQLSQPIKEQDDG